MVVREAKEFDGEINKRTKRLTRKETKKAGEITRVHAHQHRNTKYERS